jgi:hypothetical protein
MFDHIIHLGDCQQNFSSILQSFIVVPEKKSRAGSAQPQGAQRDVWGCLATTTNAR